MKILTFETSSREGKKFRLHNYFPNLSENFVMNLASKNGEIREKTKSLILNALEWSNELEADFYAFHAGFLFDPEPMELGGNLKIHALDDYSESADRFREQLYGIHESAKSLGVKIAVENNVYDKNNYKIYERQLPFLAICEHDIDDLLIEGVGLLLDFAHLKVSATVLGVDYYALCERWLPHTTGFHLSENDGYVDENKIFKFCMVCGLPEKNDLPVTLEVYDYQWQNLLDVINMLEVIMGTENA